FQSYSCYSPSSPTRRSSDLSLLCWCTFPFGPACLAPNLQCIGCCLTWKVRRPIQDVVVAAVPNTVKAEEDSLAELPRLVFKVHLDRKSTRLNSSHEWTSYAV